MRVILTGASGFVGSFVLRLLVDSGKHDVAVIVRSSHTAWRIKDLLDKVTVIHGNLSQLSLLENDISCFRPDAFIHLAWGGVMGSDRNDVRQWHNITDTLELVEVASRVGASHWIGLGSQAEYGQCQARIAESTYTQPTTLYGTSKLAACNLAKRMCDEIGIRFAWLRLFSSYGPTDNPSWMIPYLINSLLLGERPSLTCAEQLWDYIYVEDAAAAVISVLENDVAQGVFNLGSGVAIQLRVLIEKIRDRINPLLPLGFGEVAYRPDQVMHLEADISRLAKLAHWYPRVGIDEGLDRTIGWRKARNSW